MNLIGNLLSTKKKSNSHNYQTSFLDYNKDGKVDLKDAIDLASNLLSKNNNHRLNYNKHYPSNYVSHPRESYNINQRQNYSAKTSVLDYNKDGKVDFRDAIDLATDLFKSPKRTNFNQQRINTNQYSAPYHPNPNPNQYYAPYPTALPVQQIGHYYGDQNNSDRNTFPGQQHPYYPNSSPNHPMQSPLPPYPSSSQSFGWNLN